MLILVCGAGEIRAAVEDMQCRQGCLQLLCGACAILLRYSWGERPDQRLKARLKLDASLKPSRSAIDSCVISVRAR
jgi:hypothetical protein